MDELDKEIVRVAQGEFPLEAEPYKIWAARVGISEDELIERLKRYKRAGQIRKMGAVLRHREIGFSSNVLCAWVVSEACLEKVATCMAAHPAVSHCYDRSTAPEWSYNLYTMIHGHSREECDRIAESLALQNGIEERAMLYSIKEWKKTSMLYFCES